MTTTGTCAPSRGGRWSSFEVECAGGVGAMRVGGFGLAVAALVDCTMAAGFALSDVAVGAGAIGLAHMPASQTRSPLQSLSWPQPLEASEQPKRRMPMENTVINRPTFTSRAMKNGCYQSEGPLANVCADACCSLHLRRNDDLPKGLSGLERTVSLFHRVQGEDSIDSGPKLALCHVSGDR